MLRSSHILCASLAALSAADNATTIGDLVIDPPTLTCLGFQWMGTGDANRNATVSIDYRTADGAWQRGLPLHRLPREEPGLPLLAGSLVGLQPDTVYECRLTLTDPDGIQGEAQRTQTLRTAREPLAPPPTRVRHVYAPAANALRGQGDATPRQEPAYTTLAGAMKGSAKDGWGGSIDPIRAGDHLLLHAGTYAIDRFNYRDINGRHFTGSYEFPHHGTAEAPIVIRAAGDGPVVLDGQGCRTLFDLTGGRHLVFEGLHITNCDIAFQLTDKGRGEPSSDIVIRDCLFTDVAVCAYGGHPGLRNVWFTDNTCIGRQPQVVGSWGNMLSPAALGLAGRGHHALRNRCAWFWDFFNMWGFTQGGRAEPCDNSAVEVSGNDLQYMQDNAIGLNPGLNLRAHHNRIINAGDPQLDTRNNIGPTYWHHNVVFNQRPERGFKTDGGLEGLYAFHNTLSLHPLNQANFRSVMIRNNLFVGVGGKRQLSDLGAPPYPRIDLDYNGWRIMASEYADQFLLIDRKPVADWNAWRQQTGLEQHGIQVDFDVFVQAPNPYTTKGSDGNSIAFVDPAAIDLRLRDGSAAIDAGCPIPGVNDGWHGTAPDLGAYEHGQPLPAYGPRTTTWAAAWPVPRSPNHVTAQP